jgi:hypothetical protein
MRNFLATLLLSQGVPMLLGGDEVGRTQGGNNNAYCQDSEISWFDWEGINAAGRGRLARLPDDGASARWEVMVDTAADTDSDAPEVFDAGGDTEIEGRSLRLLVLRGQNGT